MGWGGVGHQCLCTRVNATHSLGWVDGLIKFIIYSFAIAFVLDATLLTF